MIKTNELRIGNLVYSTTTKENYLATWLTIKHIEDGNKNYPNDTQSLYNPIPLTEEILLKCGFVKSQAIEFGFTRPLFQYIVKRQFRWDYVIFNNDNSYSIVCDNIHYLHQLQNLYFALTGTELDTSKLL